MKKKFEILGDLDIGDVFIDKRWSYEVVRRDDKYTFVKPIKRDGSLESSEIPLNHSFSLYSFKVVKKKPLKPLVWE